MSISEADLLDGLLTAFCGAEQLAHLQPREIEAAKQHVVRLVRDRFGQKSTQAQPYIKVTRPDTANLLDDEDELTQREACERLKLASTGVGDAEASDWHLWLYVWARRVDDALVARVPAPLGAGDLDRIGAALMQVYRPHLLLFGHRDSEFLAGTRVSVTLSQRAQTAQLVFVQLRDEQGALSLLCITRGGALHHFAAPSGAWLPARLYAIARNLNLKTQGDNLQFVPVTTVPFDQLLLLYIVSEGARLAQHNQFSQLERWLSHMDQATVALFRAHLFRTHHLQHFLAEQAASVEEEEELEAVEDEQVMVIDDSSSSQSQNAPGALATSVTQLAALTNRSLDVSDAVLLDVVRHVMRPAARQCIMDPMDWHNKIVLLGRPLVVPAECDLVLVPINQSAHWSLLILTARRAWYYSSLAGDRYGATVKKLLAQSHPQLKFGELQGPQQGVDRECALYTLNMMQYTLDGHALQQQVVVTGGQRPYSRQGVQAQLMTLLSQRLQESTVVAFCVDQLINYWQQDQVIASGFLPLMQSLLQGAWPALLGAVERLARSNAVPRDALARELALLVNPVAPPPKRRMLVIDDDSDEAAPVAPVVQPLPAVVPVVQQQQQQYYELIDPVDELVAYVMELREATQLELSGKYSDASLWDGDFLAEINATLGRLAYSAKVTQLVRRSLDRLFYATDRRGNRTAQLQPADAVIREELERYRMYKK